MISQVNTRFAIDLYGRLSQSSSGVNMFFSPLSISIVLSMAFEGARGRTAEEMGQVLHFDDDPVRETVHSRMKGLLAAIDRTDDSPEAKENQVASELNGLLPQADQYELRLANGLWGARSCPFRREFVETLSNNYGDGAIDTACDFENEHESERRRINRWVAEQTKGRIEELVSAGALNPLTRLVLISAIYFRGEWATPFSKGNTRDGEFIGARGRTGLVPLMNRCDRVRYAAFNPDGIPFSTPRRVPIDDRTTHDKYPGDGGWLVLEKTYCGQEVSMVVVLPVRVDGLDALEQRFSAEALESWTGALEDWRVDVTLPKLRLKTTYLLEDTLAALGMTSAFEQPSGDGGADFGGMSESHDPLNQLYIGSVIHSAFLEVNEKGTEAAAATGIMAVGAGIPQSEMIDFVPEFRADHPFLFLIRHRKTGTLLFLGRVTDPSG